MAVTSHVPTAPEVSFDKSVRAYQLSAALDHFSPKINVLSLDCFDTLLFRKTSLPVDVFYSMQFRPAFKLHQLTALMRIRGESSARIMKLFQSGKYEVTLKDIYQQCFPHLTDEQLNALQDDEIATELEMLYAFPPMLNMIRQAQSQGKKIIIVSDTYFNQKQLTAMLTQLLPPDVMSAIDHIFCSNEYGKSKNNGLFQAVLEKLDCAPNKILHIGDNIAADFLGPRAQSIHTLHFLHHTDKFNELQRMHHSAACLMNPSIRYEQPLYDVYRGFFSTAQFDAAKPEELIGFASLGPMMFSFAKYIHGEINKLKVAGKRPKVAFLMRDAYLPWSVCDVLSDEKLGQCIRISRFASLAASFQTKYDVDRYLSETFTSNRFKDMGRQLLLPDYLLLPIIEKAIKSDVPSFKFVQLIQKPHILKVIYQNSSKYRARLFQYLKNEMRLSEGDTLVFVDLGYSATTQRLLAPIIRKELQVDVVGLYLISINMPGGDVQQHGLLEPQSTDTKTLLTLLNYIALLEQLCTTNENSVINYSDKGEPIFSKSNLKKSQHIKLESIQNECIRFAKQAQQFFHSTNIIFTPEILKDNVLSNIARLLFLPTETEINYLESFEFELNMGTEDTFQVFNLEKGLTGLKRRGIFSLFTEKNSSSLRTNMPAEFRTAGLELSLTLMAQHRFGLEFSLSDLSLRKEKINIILARGQEMTTISLLAQLTYDGYFSLLIPLGQGNFNVAVLFGQHYEWVQFESVELIKSFAFHKENESMHTQDIWPQVIFEKMQEQNQKLYHSPSQEGLMLLPEKNLVGVEHHSILRITFRPIIKR